MHGSSSRYFDNFTTFLLAPHLSIDNNPDHRSRVLCLCVQQSVSARVVERVSGCAACPAMALVEEDLPGVRKGELEWLC